MELPKILNNGIESLKSDIDNFQATFYMCEVKYIENFPNMCSNIPASPAYGVYISQFIRYARASSNYSDFLERHLYLRNRLMDQAYNKIRLIRSLKKDYIPIPRSC
jgi:hypothetical protein